MFFTLIPDNEAYSIGNDDEVGVTYDVVEYDVVEAHEIEDENIEDENDDEYYVKTNTVLEEQNNGCLNRGSKILDEIKEGQYPCVGCAYKASDYLKKHNIREHTNSKDAFETRPGDLVMPDPIG